MDDSIALWCARTAEIPGMRHWDEDMYPLPERLVELMSVLLGAKVWMGGIKYTTGFRHPTVGCLARERVMVVRHEDQGLLAEAESWPWSAASVMLQWMFEEEVNRCFGIIHKNCNALHYYG